jgi:hypothetical protein
MLYGLSSPSRKWRKEAKIKVNERAGGDGGMTVLFHAGSRPPAAPQHDRWPKA